VREQHELLKMLQKRIETNAEKGTLIENIDKITQAYLQKLNYPPALHHIYTKRMYYGLECYFQRHFKLDENFIGD
jgi:hypothetical protein